MVSYLVSIVLMMQAHSCKELPRDYPSSSISQLERIVFELNEIASSARFLRSLQMEGSLDIK